MLGLTTALLLQKQSVLTFGYLSLSASEVIISALLALRKLLRSPFAIYGRTIAGKLSSMLKHTPTKRRMLGWSKLTIIPDSAMNLSISSFSVKAKGTHEGNDQHYSLLQSRLMSYFSTSSLPLSRMSLESHCKSLHRLY